MENNTISEVIYHTFKKAPADTVPIFKAAEKAYGIVPNLFRKMAEAPALLEGYWQMNEIFSRSSLSPAEQQVVLIVETELDTPFQARAWKPAA